MDNKTTHAVIGCTHSLRQRHKALGILCLVFHGFGGFITAAAYIAGHLHNTHKAIHGLCSKCTIYALDGVDNRLKAVCINGIVYIKASKQREVCIIILAGGGNGGGGTNKPLIVSHLGAKGAVAGVIAVKL